MINSIIDSRIPQPTVTNQILVWNNTTGLFEASVSLSGLTLNGPTFQDDILWVGHLVDQILVLQVNEDARINFIGDYLTIDSAGDNYISCNAALNKIDFGNTTNDTVFNFNGFGTMTVEGDAVVSNLKVEGGFIGDTDDFQLIEIDGAGGIVTVDGDLGVTNKIQHGNAITVTTSVDLQATYDALVSDTSMGTLSETNRRYMWLTPGTYTDNLSVDTKYVHLRVMEGVVLSGAVTHTAAWYGTAFGTGSGADYDNALNIDIAEAFLAYNDIVGEDAKFLIQTANIDFTDMVQALGGMVNQGAYDGGNYQITNLVISDNPGSASSKNGLYHDHSGVLENMIFVNPVLLSSSPVAGGENKSYAGIMLAQDAFGSVVRNCHVINGTINHPHTLIGSALVGMIAGSNHGDIIDCTASGTLSATAQHAGVTTDTILSLGGITGFQTGLDQDVNSWGQVLRCKSTVNISIIDEDSSAKVFYVGGLVGEVSTIGTALGHVLNSHYDGNIYINVGNTIEAGGAKIGGITGRNDGYIEFCSAKGKMTAILNMTNGTSTRCDIGGGIGEVVGTDNITSECHSDMDMRIDCEALTAQQYIGGFVGFHSGNTDSCYSMGSIYDLAEESTTLEFEKFGGFVGYGRRGTIDDCFTAFDTYVQGTNVAHGFVGQDHADFTATTCYWDSTTSGIVAGAVAGEYDDKTSTEMYTTATFTGFVFTTAVGPWKQLDLYEYPKLLWED